MSSKFFKRNLAEFSRIYQRNSAKLKLQQNKKLAQLLINSRQDVFNEKSCLLDTDASDHEIGAVLSEI